MTSWQSVVGVPGHVVHIVPCRDLEASLLVVAVEIGVRITLSVEESIDLLYHRTGTPHYGLNLAPYLVVASRCLSKQAVMVKPIACFHPHEVWLPQ